MLKILNMLIIISLLGGTPLFSQPIVWRGQISGWSTINPDKTAEAQIGLRYIPELSLEKRISKNYAIISEISFNTYSATQFSSSHDVESTSKFKPYRLWMKLSSSQFEIRLGLQKINFGSAAILRPLMWFDRIDPRDPLQLTDGVYGVLGRYYFINNANIWLWALYGNDEAKGMEMLPSDEKKIEYGGRLQVPVLAGEMGLTYHHRQVDLEKEHLVGFLSTKNSIPEDRIGFDGKWDIGIGLWLEGALIHQDILLEPLRYQRLCCIGSDYTFPAGNGIYALAEYFALVSSDKVFGAGQSFSFSAASFNYPVNIVDTLTLMLYFNHDHNDWYRFINWQSIYDQWSFYFIGFWNPEDFQIYPNMEGNNIFAGKGFQVMAVYNY